jgi:hypothetical protein
MFIILLCPTLKFVSQKRERDFVYSECPFAVLVTLLQLKLRIPVSIMMLMKFTRKLKTLLERVNEKRILFAPSAATKQHIICITDTNILIIKILE